MGSCCAGGSDSNSNHSSRIFTVTQFADIVNYNKENKKAYVLMTDLTGLTRLTREYGVIHPVSVILRQRQILFPIISKLLKPLTIEYEADNLIIVFDDAVHAFLCGTLVLDVVQRHNQSLGTNEKHFEIAIDGVAIEVMDGVNHRIVQDKQTRVLYTISGSNSHPHDNPFHRVHLLAEEIADNGEYLISERFYKEIEHLQTEESLTFTTRNLDANGAAVQVKCESAEWMKDALNTLSALNAYSEYPPKICDLDDIEYIADDRVLSILQRYNFDQSQRIQSDSELTQKHTIENCAALMFSVSISKNNDESKTNDVGDCERSFFEKEKVLLTLLKGIYDAFDGVYEIGKSWLVFTSTSAAVDCFECALKIQSKLKEFNEQNEIYQMNMSGIGCDYGDVFLIEGTDVCFADSINTASKLG
eukprot:252695_1